jgi:very-short-patch-repair endonuclease
MPARRANPESYERARHLRQESTPAERKLWAVLRGSQLHGVKFRRQHPIGKFIVDFCSPGEKLIIELDGSQHFDQQQYDQSRTEFLECQGYRLIRFWNNAVMSDMDAVVRAIEDALKD